MMKFQVIGNNLISGRVAFDVAPLLILATTDEAKKLVEQLLVEIAGTCHREGRESVLPMYDDRYELHCAVEILRGLAAVMGPLTGDRSRRAADTLARMLQELQEVP
jgi:hypothetical protein